MSQELNLNEADGSITAEDIINPVALAKKLQAGDHRFVQCLLSKFSSRGRGALATSSESEAKPEFLAAILARELSEIVASGTSLYSAELVNGTKLRKSTTKLFKKDPTGDDLERANTLLVQDFFSKELDHDSCELVEVVKERGVEFRIYRERRKLKTKWNVSYKITFQAKAGGSTSTHAKNLDEAYIEISNLADQILKGQGPVTKQERKNRDAKAEAYDAIVKEVAKVGKKNQESILEFVKDAVKAQLKLGDRPLLEFVNEAYEKLVKPVVKCALKLAAKKFNEFVMARKHADKRYNRSQAATVNRFAAAMPAPVQLRIIAELPEGKPHPQVRTDINVDEIQPNEVQSWLNNIDAKWRFRRDLHDTIRAFLKYCRDALHALPPGLPTAAHLVPRPKPDSDAEPVPATVLCYKDVWRLLINLQDLETVWFFAIGVYAGLHQSEMLRLVWEHDIVWKGDLPVQIFVASGKGKDKSGNRMGCYVDIRPPLAEILASGKGRTGKIFKRRSLRQEKIGVVAARLGIQWDESIMRHTFVSNLSGLGYSFEEVARQARHTLTVLKRHYYAPLTKEEAEQFFSLPFAVELVNALVFQKRNWDWKSVREFQLSPDGTMEILTTSLTECQTTKRTLKKRTKRICWPDNLELQVMLWEKSQAQIGRDLGCRQTTVSNHAIRRGLICPKSEYFLRLKLGLPVEIPEEVLKARQLLAELRQREQGAAQPPSDSGSAT